MLSRGVKRLCTTQKAAPQRLFSAVALEDVNKLPPMDWDDWLMQFPTQARNGIRNTVVNQARSSEATTHFKPDDVPKIDWDFWRSQIKSPDAVDWLQAEYESRDNSNHGLFHYDDLTDEARAELLQDANAKEEVDSIGREAIENGVEKTLAKEAETRLETAEQLSGSATGWLEELYKDKEQIAANIKGYILRSKEMDAAEFPSIFREIEEQRDGGSMQAGQRIGNGVLYMCHVNRAAIRAPNMHDAGIQEEAIQAEEDNLLELEESMKSLGFEFDPEKFKATTVEEFWKRVHAHREELMRTYNYSHVDPQNTNEVQFENVKYHETPGQG